MSIESIKGRLRAWPNSDDVRCTGIAAGWCPIHGDCTCPEPENCLDDPNCPLHSFDSLHAEEVAE